MRLKLILLFFLLKTFAFAQIPRGTYIKEVIQTSQIQKALIYKMYRKPKYIEDSVAIGSSPKRLSNEEILFFAECWNQATVKSAKKTKPLYLIELYLTNNTIRVMKVSKTDIAEYDAFHFKLKDDKMIKRIWNNAKENI